MPIDFGQTSADYSQHRPDFAPKLFERLRGHGIGLPGQHVLDLGAGTGLFGRRLSESGSIVTLADVSPALLRECESPRRIAAAAEALPFDSESFDVVTAAQCWHWFDRLNAPREIQRVLRENGQLTVVYQTYIPFPGSVAAATEGLILEHNSGWRHANSTGVNGQVLRDIQAVGFVDIESFSFDVDVQFSREAWRGFIRTTSPVGAIMSAGQLANFDAEHESILNSWPANLTVPHRIFAVMVRKPRAGI